MFSSLVNRIRSAVSIGVVKDAILKHIPKDLHSKLKIDVQKNGDTFEIKFVCSEETLRQLGKKVGFGDDSAE